MPGVKWHTKSCLLVIGSLWMNQMLTASLFRTSVWSFSMWFYSHLLYVINRFKEKSACSEQTSRLSRSGCHPPFIQAVVSQAVMGKAVVLALPCKACDRETVAVEIHLTSYKYEQCSPCEHWSTLSQGMIMINTVLSPAFITRSHFCKWMIAFLKTHGLVYYQQGN